MPKYIDVDDYKKLIEREKAEVNLIGYKFEDGCKCGLGIAIEVIDEMPSADVVEVVRCKDCKHNIINHGRYCTYGDCLGCLVADDFFCKNGERRKTE